LEKRKGIDVLLECIPALLAEFPDVVFTIVGDDTVPGDDGVPFRVAFEKAEAGRSDLGRVRFTGVADDALRQRLYAGCDVFVAPSRSESFGLILLEAMMFGKPVVAGDNGGMRSIVTDGGNGYLVAPGNVEALHRAIAALVSSERLRSEFGACSRKLFEDRFSASRMVMETNRFYDQLLGRATAVFDVAPR
jgi:glycosyltransferase involved in cell wall biosynthesis